jgi:hypothetical protein
MHHFAVSLVALAVPLAALPAQAIIAQTSGLVAPARLIDFGSGLYPNFTPVTTQFAGLTVTHARYFTTGVSNNLVGGFLTNDFTGLPNTLRIQFAQPISDVSFVYHQIGQQNPSVMRAMLQNVTMDSFSILWNQSQPNNWFGFTQTAMDELQIDFDADFNLDTLAFNPIGGASCNPFNGTNVNPAGFGCVTLPVLGTTWQGSVATAANTLLTALVYAPAGLGTPVPLFGGELLVDPSLPFIAFTGTTSYSLAIPPQSSWVGTSLVFQAVRLDLVGSSPMFVPLNAMQLIVGL